MTQNGAGLKALNVGQRLFGEGRSARQERGKYRDSDRREPTPCLIRTLHGIGILEPRTLVKSLGTRDFLPRTVPKKFH